jgi:acyl-CoA synthetase (AMP-forming)/AMP-acid ligase II
MKRPRTRSKEAKVTTPGNLLNLNTDLRRKLLLDGFIYLVTAVIKMKIIFITGRTDDVINVAGHRLSTAAEMEEVVAAHPCARMCCYRNSR